MHFDVCCVGQMCTDVFLSPVNDVPERGHMSLVERATQSIGGCALNTAIGISTLGLRVALLGKVGDDGFGTFLKETLQKTGVNVDAIHQVKGAQSSMSVGLIDADGERTLLHCPGTNATLVYDDIDLNCLFHSRFMFIGGALALDRFDGRDAARLLSTAQLMGIKTAMDSSWDSTGQWMKNISPCLPHLDWFMPSLEEAEQMLGTRDPEVLAARFMEDGARNVVIKMGTKGAYVRTKGGEPFYVGIYQVTAVNAAGAGDAWCAGFIAGLVKGLDVREAAHLAAGNAALCVSAMGTTEGIRSYDETMAFIRSAPYVQPGK